MGGEGTLKYDKFQVLFLANHHSNANEVQIVGGMILYSGSGLGSRLNLEEYYSLLFNKIITCVA